LQTAKETASEDSDPEQAQERFERLIEQMKQSQGIMEKLKAENAIEWIQRMNNIRAGAIETVNSALIFI